MPRRGKSDAVRIKELEVLQAVVSNPLVLYVAGFTAIELLQKWDVVGNVAGSVAEVAMGTVAVATAIGPSLPGILGAIPSLTTTSIPALPSP